jgi:hypothetical protein
MNAKQLLGIFGSIVLGVGVFMPIISIPIIGSMSYFNDGRGDGVLVLGCAGVAFVIALTGHTGWLLIPMVISGAILGFDYLRFQGALSDFRNSVPNVNGWLDGLVDLAAQSVHIEWGWVVMLAGLALMLGAVLLRPDSKAAPQAPQTPTV